MYKLLQFYAIFWIKCIRVKCSPIQCSNRYELQTEMKEALPYLKNCEIVRLRYPICDQQITVLYSPHPPYVISVEDDNKPIGLLPDILRLAMDVCCFGCVELIFRGPMDSLQKFRNSNATIFMPLESAFDSSLLFGHDYISFVKVEGVSFLAMEMKNKATEYTRHLMETVLNTWPLLLTAILMAMISGCVIWVLDTWCNEDEFPQSFPRGPFEGFWWAFVSMTTVGYGDRAPKSFIARIFAIIWILLGITIFSMYTAVLTSALNTKSSVFEYKNFNNKKVGVLSLTGVAEAVVLQEHGNLIKFNDVEVMGNALNNYTIHALALDDNIAKYYAQQLKDRVRGLKRHHHVQGLVNSYGVLSYNRNITTFLRSFFETNEDQRDAIIRRFMQIYWANKTELDDNVIDTTTFFSSNSTIFYATIIGLLILGTSACIIGVVGQHIWKKHGNMVTRCFNGIKSKQLKSNIVKPVVPVQMELKN